MLIPELLLDERNSRLSQHFSLRLVMVDLYNADLQKWSKRLIWGDYLTIHHHPMLALSSHDLAALKRKAMKQMRRQHGRQNIFRDKTPVA